MGTDEHIINHILCETILVSSGYVSADEVTTAFSDSGDRIRQSCTAVRSMVRRIDAGLIPPVPAGMDKEQSASSAIAIAPLACLTACDSRFAAI